MKITVITLFPKMISGFFKESIIKRAIEKKLVEIEIVNLRDFAVNDYGSVDDRPYGGGAGMVIRADVVYKALEHVIPSGVRCNPVPDEVEGSLSKTEDKGISPPLIKSRSRNDKIKTLFTSPKGKVFNQQLATNYSQLDHLVIIAGHYEDVDARVLDFVDEEISMGDFVLTGGEIPAAAIVDSIVRLIPGVLKKDATKLESFFYVSINRLIDTIGEIEELKKLKEKGIKEVRLLEYTQYTRPEDFMGKKVPEVLLQGNHKEIGNWRLKKAYEETLKKRPDFLK